jgi:hypothetical protein
LRAASELAPLALVFGGSTVGLWAGAATMLATQANNSRWKFAITISAPRAAVGFDRRIAETLSLSGVGMESKIYAGFRPCESPAS